MSGLEAKLARRREEAAKKKEGQVAVPATDVPVDSQDAPTEPPTSSSGLPSESLVGLMDNRDPDAIIIQVDELVIRPQIREYFDEDSLRELAEDMREHRQFVPVVVRRLADKRYELVDGERRVRAKALLREWEPTNIEHSLVRATLQLIPDDLLRLRQLAANIQREALQPIEEAKALASIKEDLGLSDTELAEKIKKSQSYISRSLSLLRLSEPLQYLVETGTVGRRRAIMESESVLQQAVESLPAALHAQVEAEEISLIDALKKEEVVTEADKPKTDKPKTAPKVSVPLKTATDLGDLLAILANQLDLAPVIITKQKGKFVRKELLTVLEQRTADILRAVKTRV